MQDNFSNMNFYHRPIYVQHGKYRIPKGDGGYTEQITTMKPWYSGPWNNGIPWNSGKTALKFF